MDMVYILGEKIELMKEAGFCEKLKEKENLNIKMEVIMMENLKKEKNGEKDYMFGIKINILKEIGKMINRMDLDYIIKTEKK